MYTITFSNDTTTRTFTKDGEQAAQALCEKYNAYHGTCVSVKSVLMPRAVRRAQLVRRGAAADFDHAFPTPESTRAYFAAIRTDIETNLEGLG